MKEHEIATLLNLYISGVLLLSIGLGLYMGKASSAFITMASGLLIAALTYYIHVLIKKK